MRKPAREQDGFGLGFGIGFGAHKFVERLFNTHRLAATNPQYWKESSSSPDPTSAARNADGPGIGTTSMSSLCRTASLITNAPGSLIPGMPASLTSATCCPPRSSEITEDVLWYSLCI